MRRAADTVIIGCGILRREISLLAEKNGWELEGRFLDPSLHIDFEKLERGLKGHLRKLDGRSIVVCYGECHPLIDIMVKETGGVRMASQNCVEMLLGPEDFLDELSRGAFFLTEDWACRFEELTRKTFGNNLPVAREIFMSHHHYLLGLRTPCSHDFQSEAEAASRFIGLPLRWRDVGLDRLEVLLADALNRAGHRSWAIT